MTLIISSPTASFLIKRETPRPFQFTLNINPHVLGSCLVEFGLTKVYVTVSCEETVPPFLKDKNQGWLTAEYAMLPGSSSQRIQRERKGPSGRTQEIQRLIGRSLRGVIDLQKLGPRTLTIDCDVLVADGGTRTSSINGAYLALYSAIQKLLKQQKITENPLKETLAAISIGIMPNRDILADLNYEEDSSCSTDMNLVMTQSGHFLEIQGTAEGAAYSQEELQGMIQCGRSALAKIFQRIDEEKRRIIS